MTDRKIIDCPCPTCGQPSVGIQDDDGKAALDCWKCTLKTATPCEPRLFIGYFPAGISYADRQTEEHGDYKKVAFLDYATLTLTLYACPVELLADIRQDAATIQARRGEDLVVSQCGQTVRLGE